MAKLAKVVTSKMTIWANNGKAMLAKCAKSGKWVKLDNAQWLLDNLALLACKAFSKAASVTQSTHAAIEFDKAVSFFGVVGIWSNVRSCNQPTAYLTKLALTSN